MTYCLQCPDCNSKKYSTQREAGLHPPIGITAIFERIGIDLLGPFPESQNGNKYCILATEYLTKIEFSRAIPTKMTDEVAKFLMEEVIAKIEVKLRSREVYSIRPW